MWEVSALGSEAAATASLPCEEACGDWVDALASIWKRPSSRNARVRRSALPATSGRFRRECVAMVVFPALPYSFANRLSSRARRWVYEVDFAGAMPSRAISRSCSCSESFEESPTRVGGATVGERDGGRSGERGVEGDVGGGGERDGEGNGNGGGNEMTMACGNDASRP